MNERKRLIRLDPHGELHDSIHEAEFAEVDDIATAPLTRKTPASSTRHSHAGAFGKAVTILIAASIIIVIALFLTGLLAGPTSGPVDGASDPITDTVVYPAGVRPEAGMLIDAGDSEPETTRHTMGNLLCPLIADGWLVEPTVKKAKELRSGETIRSITYVLKRDGDMPMMIVTTRHEGPDGQPLELLQRMRIAGRSYPGSKMWPVVNEIFTQNLSQCRVSSGDNQ